MSNSSSRKHIGIITLPLHTNYGGILQAYALQTTLERLGHRASLIRTAEWTRTSLPWKLAPFVIAKRTLRKYVHHEDIQVFEEQQLRRILRHTAKFVKKHIHTFRVKDYAALGQTDSFDAYVVGSDQVWRPLYFTEGIANAFLKFAEHQAVKRIAYAPSFGVDTWECNERETIECRRLLQQFDAVSVRETSATDLCRQHLGRTDVQWVLDPTMLLDVEDYRQLFLNAHTPQSEGTLMTYVLDDTPEKQRLVQKISQTLGLKVFSTNSRCEDRTAPLRERIQPPVEQWLRGFHDAEFVVTDSFHACVFSILFRKQFVVVANHSRGNARIDSLLSMFGIEDRKVDAAVLALPENPINYDKVYETLAVRRQESLDFLKRALA